MVQQRIYVLRQNSHYMSTKSHSLKIYYTDLIVLVLSIYLYNVKPATVLTFRFTTKK